MVAALRSKLQSIDSEFKLLSKNKQLNHYFVGGTLDALVKKIEGHLSPEQFKKLEDMAMRATGVSVRTRNKDGEVLLVVEA